MKKLALAAALLASSVVAQAGVNDFIAPGAYTITTVQNTRADGGFNATGVGFRLGFGFGNGLSIEGGYDYLGKEFGIRFSDINVAAVYAYPLTPNFALRGSVGATRVEARANGQRADDSAPLFGIGAEYLIGRNIFVLGEYRYFARDIKGDNLNLGLKLRF